MIRALRTPLKKVKEAIIIIGGKDTVLNTWATFTLSTARDSFVRHPIPIGVTKRNILP